MRAILIDPIAKEVRETEFDGNYKQIYQHLSDAEHGLEVDDFNVVNLNADRSETLFVDGEGLLKEDMTFFFKWRDYHQPLAGRGLILGCDGEGESVATQLTVDYVKSMVTYMRLSVEGFVTEQGKKEMFGKEFHMIRQTPIFGPPRSK